MGPPTAPPHAHRAVVSRHNAIHSKRSYSARGFYLIVFVFCGIASFKYLVERHAVGDSTSGMLARRTLGILQAGEDTDCHLVHKANDQCAFIKAHCPDEEAGLLSYLTLYYCDLPKAKPFAFFILVSWLGILFTTIGIAASDFFCVNLSTISYILGMSESMAGVTLLAFGNGSADVFSTFAAFRTHSGSLAVGELIGAAGFITAVVAGSMALIRPFQVAKKSFVRDLGFFIVATGFSMVFLYDGKLYWWECVVMIGFYIFYAAFVVVWHWWLGQRRKRREKENLSRSHFQNPGDEDLAQQEPYHDEPGEDFDRPISAAPSRGISIDDFSALERGRVSPRIEVYEDDEEEARERWLAELSNNMRVSRPQLGERRATSSAIRPSLVGALEFQSVLTSLRKSRNHLMPLEGRSRRFSDDPTYTTAQQQDQMSTMTDPAQRPPYEVNVQDADGTSLRPSLDVRDTPQGRIRAVSTNDMDGLQIDSSVLHPDAAPSLENVDRNPHGSNLRPSSSRLSFTASDGSLSPIPRSRAPTNASIASEPRHHSITQQPEPRSTRPRRRDTPDFLHPPPDGHMAPHHREVSPPPLIHVEDGDKPPSPRGARPPQPRIQIPSPQPVRPGHHRGRSSGPSSPFPAFMDYLDYSPTASTRPPSIRLPAPSASPEYFYHPDPLAVEDEKISWWPYDKLPAPAVLTSTLFPTLYSWRDKRIWEKALGVVTAPSVFLLTITLPIVERGEDREGSADSIPNLSLPTPRQPTLDQRKSSVTIVEPDNNDPLIAHAQANAKDSKGSTNDEAASDAVEEQADHRPSLPMIISPQEHRPSQPMILSPTDHHNHVLDSPEQVPISPPSSPKDWNRWLVITQTFLAPYFIVLIGWANMVDEPTSSEGARALLQPSLYSLLGSTIVLGLILFTSDSQKEPRWRIGLCFVGFIVSIAWISTIANEVVGVLKAIGVILDISDAILGLTIFAVGNSLGDLVADITVARLGFPVMALSACFGGPMLNILLGIGISGLYMTVSGAERREHKHPGRGRVYKPYRIEVSRTLLISGVTLLVTLVGLLIFVPLNGWRMDRKIGVGLLAVWAVSTVGNVVVEVLGLAGDVSLWPF